MEQHTDEDFYLNNIKHEPPVEFVLILPNLEQQTTQNIKFEENEINKMKECTIRVEKFDRRWRKKPTMFSTKRFCERCKVISSSRVLKHSTSCDQKADKDLKLCKCDLCPVKHKFKRFLRDHMRCHRKHRSFVCSDCGFGFKTKHCLLGHIRRQKPMKCEICKEKFECQFALLKHEKIHSNNFKCHQCFYVGSTKEHLQQHKLSHLLKFKCETCDKNFARKDSLISHQKSNKHGNFASAAVPKFYCDECDHFSLTAQNFNAHKKSVHENLNFTCDLCSKVFKCRSYLWAHMTVHAKTSCHICNKEVSKRYLPQHLKEHLESTEYNCDLCGGQLRKRKAIKMHMVQVHPNGEHVCILCRKKFETVHELFAHKKIHAGVRDFRCPKCNHKATSMFDMKLHTSKRH